MLAANRNSLILLAGLQEKFFRGFSYLAQKYSGEYSGEKINYLYGLPYYPGVEYINDNLSHHDRVAFLGEDRTFYMKKPFLASSFNDRNVILDTLRDSGSSPEFRMKLELLGISHIYFSPSGLDRMGRSSPVYRLSASLRGELESRLLDLPVLYRDKHYILYRVRQY